MKKHLRNKSNIKRKRTHGFLARTATPGGQGEGQGQSRQPDRPGTG